MSPRAEIVYKSDKKEVVHSISVYQDFYLCIIASPARKGGGRYLRSVELRREPIPAIVTRMFKEAPFGYICQREAMLLPRDVEVKRVIHPLLVEPFPDELGVIDGEVWMRRRMDGRELTYECTLRETGELGFPLIEEYSRGVDGEKERFKLKNLALGPV